LRAGCRARADAAANIHIKSIWTTTVLPRGSITRHITLRIVQNIIATAIELIPTVTFSAVFDTEIRVSWACRSADLRTHDRIVCVGVWCQGTSDVTLRVTSKTDA
jgi:hypothetical protein